MNLIKFTSGVLDQAHLDDNAANGVAANAPFSIITTIRLTDLAGDGFQYFVSNGPLDNTNAINILHLEEDFPVTEQSGGGVRGLRAFIGSINNAFVPGINLSGGNVYVIAVMRSDTGQIKMITCPLNGTATLHPQTAASLYPSPSDYQDLVVNNAISSTDWALGRRVGDDTNTREYANYLGGFIKLNREMTVEEMEAYASSGDITTAVEAAAIDLNYEFNEASGRTFVDSETGGNITYYSNNSGGTSDPAEFYPLTFDNPPAEEPEPPATGGYTVHGVDDQVSYDSCTVQSWSYVDNSGVDEIHIDNFEQRVVTGTYDQTEQFNSFFYLSGVNGKRPRIIHNSQDTWNDDEHPYVYSYTCRPGEWFPFDTRSGGSIGGSTVTHRNNNPFTEDGVYIARAPTYPTWMMDILVSEWKAHSLVAPTAPGDANLVVGTTTERTSVNGRVAPAGLNLYEFKIEDTSLNPATRDRKLVVNMSAGAHPSEVCGYQSLYNSVDWILNGDDPLRTLLLQECIFIVRPMLFPAAMYVGYYRSDVPETADAGTSNDCTLYNSNRYWGDGMAGSVPQPTTLQWLAIMAQTNEGKCDISFDYHTTPSPEQMDVFFGNGENVSGTPSTYAAKMQAYNANFGALGYDFTGGDTVSVTGKDWDNGATIAATPEYAIQLGHNFALNKQFGEAVIKSLSQLIQEGWVDDNLRLAASYSTDPEYSLVELLGSTNTHIASFGGTAYSGQASIAPLAGQNRMAVISVVWETGSGPLTLSNAQWAGVNLTEKSNHKMIIESAENSVYFLYVMEADYPSGAGNITFNLSGPPGNNLNVHIAQYANVDQTAPFNDSKQSFRDNGTVLNMSMPVDHEKSLIHGVLTEGSGVTNFSLLSNATFLHSSNISDMAVGVFNATNVDSETLFSINNSQTFIRGILTGFTINSAVVDISPPVERPGLIRRPIRRLIRQPIRSLIR